MKVLIVDDSATMRAGLSRMVEKMGHVACVEGSGPAAIERCRLERPDMILLDVLMHGMDGYDTARQLRQIGVGDWLPIIFLSSREDDQDLERGIEAGGDDYLVKPVSYVVLNAKILAMQRIVDMRRHLMQTTAALEAANQRLEQLSHYDGLTGIGNRRALDGYLQAEVERARRTQTAVSALLIDVDHFKRFNDRYGHLAGDECLKRVAATIQATCRRQTDLTARYGGEEFAVVLPGTDIDGAMLAGRAVLAAVAGLNIRHEGNDHGVVTVSIGACGVIPDRGFSAEHLLALADQALYQAKAQGRHRIAAANATASV